MSSGTVCLGRRALLSCFATTATRVGGFILSGEGEPGKSGQPETGAAPEAPSETQRGPAEAKQRCGPVGCGHHGFEFFARLDVPLLIML